MAESRVTSLCERIYGIDPKTVPKVVATKGPLLPALTYEAGVEATSDAAAEEGYVKIGQNVPPEDKSELLQGSTPAAPTNDPTRLETSGERVGSNLPKFNWQKWFKSNYQKILEFMNTSRDLPPLISQMDELAFQLRLIRLPFGMLNFSLCVSKNKCFFLQFPNKNGGKTSCKRIRNCGTDLMYLSPSQEMPFHYLY